MRSVRWARAALEDLASLDDYFRERDAAVAEAITRKAVAAARFLADHPAAGERLPNRTLRKWSVRGTPYILLYRPTDDALRIVRVVHAARDWAKFL